MTDNAVAAIRAIEIVTELVWKEHWGGSLDDIPEWRAETPFGSITVSMAGHRDASGKSYTHHCYVPDELEDHLQREAHGRFATRILSALSPAFLKRIEALEAENVRLREALKPFSVVGDTIEKLYPDYRDFVQLFMGLDHGDFRRARAALTQGGQTDD